MSRLLNPLLSLVDKVIIVTSNLTFVILNFAESAALGKM